MKYSIKTHGKTAYGYGCRCDICKESNTESMKAFRSRVAGTEPPSHGKSGYNNYGCRCSVCVAANRVSNQLARYGVTVYELLVKQDGFCALCCTAIEVETAVIDHCHATGVVRGALCRRCNTALGKFGDDPKKLRSAIRYLTTS